MNLTDAVTSICAVEREDKRETHGECIDQLQENVIDRCGQHHHHPKKCLAWVRYRRREVVDQAILDQSVGQRWTRPEAFQ